MKTESLRIVNRGRGPQLSTSRITVLDVFYYLHRGHDFDVVHQVMPSLTREEFDLIVEHVKEHHVELAEKDRKAEEFIRKGTEAQQARGGIFAAPDENLTTEEWVCRLREKMKRRMAEKAREPIEFRHKRIHRNNESTP